MSIRNTAVTAFSAQAWAKTRGAAASRPRRFSSWVSGSRWASSALRVLSDRSASENTWPNSRVTMRVAVSPTTRNATKATSVPGSSSTRTP